MLISWVNKFSLIEYPGEISCVIFTPGCNMRCKFCHNDEFVLPEKLKTVMNNLIPEEVFFNFLKDRKHALTGVSICGWEPTVQKDLIDFCRKIKSMWFKVKLDTNWRDSKIIKELIDEELVDYIAMDIKHIIPKIDDLVWIKIDKWEYLKTIEIIINSNIEHEFRTTVIKWVHDEESIEEMSKLIEWSNNYYLQNFRKEKTLDPNFKWLPFKSKELEKFKKIAEKYINNVWIRT